MSTRYSPENEPGPSGPSTAFPSRISTLQAEADARDQLNLLTNALDHGTHSPSELEDGHDGQAHRDECGERNIVEEKSTLKLTDQTNLLPFRKVVPVFMGLAVCVVVSTLDQTLVATALSSITAYFHAGSVSSFVPSTYLLTSTAFQPLYGRFSDIFGRKATLCIAMVIFMIGNLAAGFSRSIAEVIVFRGIAGAGGGGIISVAQIIMSDVVSLRDRGKYQGIIGVVIAMGYSVGPLIGGVLSEKVTWRWCFWITIPLSLGGILVVLYILPLKNVEGNMKRKLLAIDYVGTGLTLSGCTLVILPLIWGGITFPWRSAIVIVTLISGVCLVSIFCLWEWKGAKLPIVPMYIFKHQTVSGVYITMFVNGFIFNSSLYYLPQFFQTALGFSPIRTGVFLLPVLVSQTVASFISGNLVSRTGRYRTIIYVGFSIWAIGCGLLSTVSSSLSRVNLVVYMFIAGIGAGQTLQTTTVAAQASVSRKDMSVVTAVRNFVRLLGGTLSLAIGSTIINNSLRSRMASLGLASSEVDAIIDDPTVLYPLLSSSSSGSSLSNITSSMASQILAGYTHGVRSVFILNACLSTLCVFVAFFMIHHKELIRADEAEMRRRAKAQIEMESKTEKGTMPAKASERKGVVEAVCLSNSSERKGESDAAMVKV